MMILLITLLAIVLFEGIKFSRKIIKDEISEKDRKSYIIMIFIDFAIFILVSILLYLDYKAAGNNRFISYAGIVVILLVIFRLIMQDRKSVV